MKESLALPKLNKGPRHWQALSCAGLGVAATGADMQPGKESKMEGNRDCAELLEPRMPGQRQRQGSSGSWPPPGLGMALEAGLLPQ